MIPRRASFEIEKAKSREYAKNIQEEAQRTEEEIFSKKVKDEVLKPLLQKLYSDDWLLTEIQCNSRTSADFKSVRIILEIKSYDPISS